MDIDAMFDEVPESYLLKEGDIIFWPKEKGKIKHLHGSAGTFRRLGLSVGNRWGAVDHNELKSIFQNHVNDNRLFIVTQVISQTDGMRDGVLRSAQLFNVSTGPVYTGPQTTRVRIHELPMDFVLNDLRCHDEVLSLYSTMILHKFLRDYQEEILAHDVPMDLYPVLNYFREMINENVLQSNKLPELLWAGSEHSERADDVRMDWLINDGLVYIRKSVADTGANPDIHNFNVEEPESSHTLALHTQVFAEAMRYGVKLFRPSEEFMKEYTKRFVSYVMCGLAIRRKMLATQAAKIIETLADQQAKYSETIAPCVEASSKYKAESAELFKEFNDWIEKGMIKS